MRKSIIGSVTAAAVILAIPAAALAHVVVTPAQADVGARTMFNVSVPNERETAVTNIKLVIPKGLEDVQPDVMAGWNITTTQDAGGNVTAIDWAGTIPVGQRADFAFKAQAPADAGEIGWKAYQTYADGTVVSWDQKPTANAVDDDSATVGPYSVTKVVDDLDTATPSAAKNTSRDTLALGLSAAALALSIVSLSLRLRRKS